MNMPIVRLEVEHMKHSIQMACTEYIAKMDADIQAAVERVCTPEHISDVVCRAAKETIDKAVDEEVRSFYRYGAGREAVRKAVVDTLTEKETK